MSSPGAIPPRLPEFASRPASPFYDNDWRRCPLEHMEESNACEDFERTEPGQSGVFHPQIRWHTKAERGGPGRVRGTGGPPEKEGTSV
jgi:hypothetical protein